MTRDELSELLSPQGRDAVLAAFAGSTRRIPVKASALVARVPDLPMDDAKALVDLAAGCSEYFPSGAREKAARRDALIRAGRARGVTVGDLAVEHNCSERTVKNAIKRTEP